MNVPICTAVGDQWNPSAVPDGVGGTIVSWRDQRNGTNDIYAQRIAADGTIQWASDGVAIHTDTGDPNPASMIADGQGGAIFVWRDHRSGDTDIYAQRILADGTIQWTTGGVALCTIAGDQSPSRIISDGAGGVIVAWQNYGTASDDVYAQRVLGNGTVHWHANGVALCTATGLQSVSGMVTDESGGAIVIWNDERSGNSDIYAQRVDGDGIVQWTANGVALCTAPGTQRNTGPSIIADGAGGAITVWQDQRSGDADVYAQRIASDGNIPWTSNGIVLCSAAGTQSPYQVFSDNAGGAIVDWVDQRAGNLDIYAQRISPAGDVEWAPNGIAVTSATGDQLPASGISDGSGGIIVPWREQPGDSWDLYVQRVSVDGVVQWTSGGVPVCTAPGDQSLFVAIPDGVGGAILSWLDPRSGRDDIYVQRIAADGMPQWTADGVAICTAAGDRYVPRLVLDDAGGVTAVWHDRRSGNWDIFAQWIGSDGMFVGPEPQIVSVGDIAADQGGKVRIKWKASYLDTLPTLGIALYGIWRQVEESAALRALKAGAKLSVPGAGAQQAQPHTLRAIQSPTGTTYWEGVGTVAARGYSTYTFIALTFQDSTAEDNPYSVFMVDSHASLWPGYWSSSPDSGYSVDNLAPDRPAPFVGLYGVSGVTLHWGPNSEKDLFGYRLYRATSADFLPSLSNLLSAQADTGYVDSYGSTKYYYKLTAIDVHGNESPFAFVSPDGPTGTLISLQSADVGPGIVRLIWFTTSQAAATVFRRTESSPWAPLATIEANGDGRFEFEDRGIGSGHYGYRLGLDGSGGEVFAGEVWVIVPTLELGVSVQPNPSVGQEVRLSLTLPTSRTCKLQLIDVTGRLLESQDIEGLSAGTHRVVLGQGRRLSPGVYLVRIAQGSETRTRRAVVMR